MAGVLPDDPARADGAAAFTAAEPVSLEVRVLGPLEVVVGGRLVPAGGAKQRALLARPLLDEGRTVSTDQLVDDLSAVHASARRQPRPRLSRRSGAGARAEPPLRWRWPR